MTDRSVRILELKKTILADNDADAEALREELRARGVYYLNVMSSPGSGKTTAILEILERLPKTIRAGVMEADIDSDVDARTIAKAGYPTIQLHTGGMCHLDAAMSRQGLEGIGIDALDLVILENVGNLVCPAEFDTGAMCDLVILSVPEGDDKPLKYPLMFGKADLVLINKIDAMEAFDFDADACRKAIRMRNDKAKVFFVSALTGEGFDAVVEELVAAIGRVKEGKEDGDA